MEHRGEGTTGVNDEVQKTEDKLREAGLRYHTLFNQSPDGILIIDGDGKIIEFNEAAHRQLGYVREEFERLHLSDIDPFQSYEEIQASIRHVIDHGSAEFEVKHLTKAGEIRDVHVITQLMTLSGRTAFHTIWRDITEQKRTEKALIESIRKTAEEKAKTEAIIASIGEGITIRDVNYRLLYQNNLITETLGYHVGEFCYQAFHGLAQVCTECPAELSFKDGKTHTAEKSVPANTGFEYFETTASPIRDSTGKIIAAIELVRNITEHKAADEELKETNARLQALVNAIPDIVLFKDIQGRYLVVNKAVEQSTGLRREELVGKTNDEILPPDIAVQCNTSDATAMESLKPLHFEEQARGKDGETKFLDTIKAPIHDDQGKRIGLLAVSRDITERKRMEQLLRESEERLGQAVRVSQIGIFDHDHRANTVYWSPEQRKTYGWGAAEPANLPAFLACVHPEDRKRIAASVQRAHDPAGDGLFDIEHRIIRRDDEVRWVSTRSRTFFEGEGDALRPIRTVGATLDITERKHAEESLRKSETFIKNILETVDEGFIVIDREYKIISANKAFLAQAHVPLDAALGKHCYEISHHIIKPCFEVGEDCAVRRSFNTGEPHTAIHTHHDEKGEPVTVEIKSYPVKAESGNIVSVIEVLNNITEKKKLEDQLRHSQKLEAIGHLAGGIAHDFNNILTAIIGYGSLMKMKFAEDDPQKYNLQQILDSADRAANLTRGLLAFSRKQVMSVKPVNLNEIVKKVEKLLLRLIGEDVKLTVTLSDQELTVKADTSQVEQVLMNLATNARDAMPEGGSLTISTEPAVLGHEFIMQGYAASGMHALISVTDTGMGMDEKTQENIFEPFFTTKEVGKGTGLGLSIVYGIVKQHNGFITCSSDPRLGTTFKIYLPTIKSGCAKTETAPLPAVGGTETVLLAEDDATVSTLLKAILKQYGYTVIEASDGEDAISKFRENRDTIQLLILDVIMPKKNGKEVYDEIRKDRPGVKAIFTSGYTADTIRRKGIHEKGFTFVSKPISPATLLGKIRETLDTT